MVVLFLFWWLILKFFSSIVCFSCVGYGYNFIFGVWLGERIVIGFFESIGECFGFC